MGLGDRIADTEPVRDTHDFSGVFVQKRLLRLLSRDRVDPTPMTTHEFDFEDIDEGFRLMETKADDIIKPLIDFE